jgi:hypothetical protein
MKHPLEDVFNIEEGSFNPTSGVEFDIEQEYGMTDVTQPSNVQPTEPQPDVKDADDIETEKKIDEVYNSAISTFQNQIAYTEIIEPRYAARNAEVAATYLNIALAAATSKAKIKVERKKVNQFIPYANGGKTTNNIVVADRNDILKMITIDSQTKEIK